MGIRRFCFVVLVLFVVAPLAAGAKDSPRLAPDLSRYEGRTVESVDVSVEEASVDEAALAFGFARGFTPSPSSTALYFGSRNVSFFNPVT